MFSPSINQAPPSGRTSRRRQRPLSNEGSIAQPKAKRQRSALSEQTFLPPDDTPEMEETKSRKGATFRKREVSRELSGPRREIAVRSRKPKPGDRAGNKEDGTLVLTQNDTYIVTKLPALPDRLSTDIAARQHGAVFSDTGYALTLTHSHAIVWPYAVKIPSPETFTFALPYPSKNISDPLPLGTLVSASASSTEPGLVVVIPTTGKITYWESIASAATLDLIRQQRNGVEFTIPGMHSGEVVVQILNAESAGFVLAFSTGRLAYMNVRDGQGRPGIAVQFLRTNGGVSTGGLFGSIRNVLGTYASHGNIAAVRAGRPEKVGVRNIVVATEKGKIQSWNIHRGGHASIQAEIDGRERMVEAIKESQPSLRDLLLESFEICDFTFTPKSIVDTQLSEQGNEGVHLLILASLTSRHSTHYSLIEIFLAQNDFTVGSIRPIKSYSTPLNRKAISRPRLYLPNPALVAYAIFDQAVVVISMAKQPDSPESQLRSENHLLPLTFEDVVDFRGAMNVEIAGSGMEEPQGPSHGIEDTKSHRYKAKHPSVVLLVRGGGVVRIAATDIGKLTSSNAQQVTAKSKLFQAVFYGTIEKNPLSFAVRQELQFPPEEVGTAALELSLDILRCLVPQLQTIASTEMNLRQRSIALRHLAEYLKNSAVELDRVTRWKLLWNAEKIEAASSIWSKYNASLKSKPEGQKRGLLTDLVESIHEDYKHNPVSEAGELDRVRTWFIYDIWNLEIAVPWAYQALKQIYQDGQNDHNTLLQTISEADDVVIGALETAFQFRTLNLALYGLQNEKLELGVLKSNYEGLPEFWTSTFFIVDNVRKQTELGGALAKEFWRKSGKLRGNVDSDVLQKVRLDNPGLVDLAIRTSTERMRWNLAQNSPELQMEAEQLQVLKISSEDEQITLLATDLDLGNDAISIAEKHQIMPTLAAVIMIEANNCANLMHKVGLNSEEFDYASARENVLESRVNDYFDKFGVRWATALYEHDIESGGGIYNLLNTYQDRQEFLTAFLRSKPEYAKISWIQEVTREHNFDQAAQALLDLGLKRERDLWSKKIELSLGKLARLEGRKYSQTNGLIIPDGGQIELVTTSHELELIKIQDRVYDHVFPSIETAIDDKAEIQLAMEAHGNKRLRTLKTFSAFLEENMGHLIRHESMDPWSLIDLLTLMDGGEIPQNQTDFRSQQFYLALRASLHGIAGKNEQRLIQQVIWRRCMLRDDWNVVNDTDSKDDQEVNDQLRNTTLYLTFLACYQNRMFAGESPMVPISPQAILGAGTEELHERFNGLDVSIRDGILKDMQSEDDALAPYVETCRLEKWHQSALDLAKEDFTEQVDDETDDGKKMHDAALALEKIEKQIADNVKSDALKAFHKGTIDGSKGKYKSSSRRY